MSFCCAKASELMTQAPIFHFETFSPWKVRPRSTEVSRYISRCTVSKAERNRTRSAVRTREGVHAAATTDAGFRLVDHGFLLEGLAVI